MLKQEAISTKVQSASLQPKHVFGIRTDLQNCIQYFSQDKCAYIAGYYGVICKIKGNDQFFYPAIAEYNEITSFCVDESSDCIVFFMSQKVNDKIYFIFRYLNKSDLSVEPGKTKTLYFQGDKLHVIASSLNLSNGVFAALIGPSAPSMVIIYSGESKYNPKIKNKILLTTSFPYSNLNINSYDTEQFSVWGDGGYALINLRNKEIKTESTAANTPDFAKYSFNIVSCTWLSKDRVAFLNDSCDIFVIYFSIHKTVLRALIKWNSIFEVPTKGVALFDKNSNGFVTTSDGLIVKLDKKTVNDKVTFEKPSSTFKPSKLPLMELLCLSASKVNETSQNFGVLMVTANGQIYVLDGTNDNAISDGANYKFGLCSFHSDDIISIDVSKWKQLVATCSKDKTVRIWNYINLQLEAIEYYDEDPLLVSFHPNGLHLAILFKDKIRLVDILENSLKEFREFRVFQPHSIKFSSFGTMLSVCYKSFFQIYNFFTGESILESKELVQKNPTGSSHKDELKSLTWDLDDSGFSTCGSDGHVIYWNGSNYTQSISYQEKNTIFKSTEIMNMDDAISKKIGAGSDTGLKEIYYAQPNKDDDNKDHQTLQNKVIQEGKYSSMIFDQELKLIFLATPNDQTCSITIVDYAKYSMGLVQKNPLMFQANSMGVCSIKASYDMAHVFSGGNDRCLFFFFLVNVSKSKDKQDIEIHEPENLIGIPKEDLDKNAERLRNELNEKDKRIIREEEDFQEDYRKTNNEIEEQTGIGMEIKKAFDEEKQNGEDEIEDKTENYMNKLNEIRNEHEAKLEKLLHEHEENMNAKEEDKKNEEKVLHDEKIKDEKILRDRKNKIADAEKNGSDYHRGIGEELNTQIKELQDKQSELKATAENEKTDLMNTNDKDIAEKRRDGDKLKQYYEKTKQDHKEQEEKLKEAIEKIRKDNKDINSKRERKNKELDSIRKDNQKLEKQIRDLKNDGAEKEDTINDKKKGKSKLDKDNQELEKFKYVLHYKIKELKHSKEPKEKKIQQMEKKAKDMEREIKSCEGGQATIIIELSTNHQIIKIHEEQISKTEKRIEELRKYKKLFQENLYNSMKRAKNHKDCKKEGVLLKRNFLDKEKIDNIEKPFEANYELQREFLEKNVDHYKNKISKLNDIFVNDHNKVMKEKRQLIEIVNQGEKEKKEIEENDNYKKDNVSSITKPKTKSKPDVPRFPHEKKKKKIEEEENDEEDQDEIEGKELANKLKDIEKEIQWYKYWDKKIKHEDAIQNKKFNGAD